MERTDAYTPHLSHIQAAPRVKEPAFFSRNEFATLRALCEIALPHSKIDLAGEIDTKLASGGGKGWRYDVLPPDEIMYREAIEAIDELSGGSFARLDEDTQRKVFARIPRSIAKPLWMSFFWDEFLVEITEKHFTAD